MIKETKKTSSGAKIVIYLILCLFALWILAPFYIVVITSFKTLKEASDSTVMFTYWPKEFSFQAYQTTLLNDYTISASGFSSVLIGFKNTLLILVPPVFIGLFSSSLSGFAFTRLKFPGKNVMFRILLLTMMIPSTLTLVPAFKWYYTLGWVGTPLPLIVHGCFGSAVTVFFMRQYFAGLPASLNEAASIDGLGNFGIFLKIILPLSVPALIAQGVLGFIGACNAYLGPLIYLQAQGLRELYTLQIALKNFQLNHRNDYPVIMAATLIALVPELCIYAFCQKFFVEGIATTGIKG